MQVSRQPYAHSALVSAAGYTFTTVAFPRVHERINLLPHDDVPEIHVKDDHRRKAGGTGGNRGIGKGGEADLDGAG